MAVTTNSLATMIAEELQIIGAGEPLSADDADKIKDRIGKRRAFLVEEGLCYWPDNEIPDAASMALAKIGAEDCKSIFGLIYERGAEGLMELRKHCARRASTEPLVVDYF